MDGQIVTYLLKDGEGNTLITRTDDLETALLDSEWGKFFELVYEKGRSSARERRNGRSVKWEITTVNIEEDIELDTLLLI